MKQRFNVRQFQIVPTFPLYHLARNVWLLQAQRNYIKFYSSLLGKDCYTTRCKSNYILQNEQERRANLELDIGFAFCYFPLCCHLHFPCNQLSSDRLSRDLLIASCLSRPVNFLMVVVEQLLNHSTSVFPINSPPPLIFSLQGKTQKNLYFPLKLKRKTVNPVPAKLAPEAAANCYVSF